MRENEKPRKDNTEMTESEMAMRKFLKALGVTTHQKLETALAEAVASGRFDAQQSVSITAKIEIAALDFNHEVSATLLAPEKSS